MADVDWIDFCHRDLGTLIDCNAPFKEGYFPDNLISPQAFAKKKGFIADHFVRPPVSLFISFQHAVQICRISINTRVESQKVTLLEIWIKSSNCDQSVVSDNGEGWTKVGRAHTGGFSQSTGLTLSNNSIVDDKDDYCLFQNFYLPGGNRYSSNLLPYTFRLSHPELLEKVSGLEIRILRTANSSSPCISALKIQGLPSSSNPLSARTFILEKWKKLQEDELSTLASGKDQKSYGHRFFGNDEVEDTNLKGAQALGPSSSIDISPVVENSKKATLDAKEEEEEVPADFLDALTFCLMDVPMVLPCGQTVDKKNLDLHIENEGKWGRLANDPFTGKPFTNKSKPVFDPILKSRIDAYVLGRNGISISQVRKKNSVLGKRNFSQQRLPVSIVSDKRKIFAANAITAQSHHQTSAVFSTVEQPVPGRHHLRLPPVLASASSASAVSVKHSTLARRFVKKTTANRLPINLKSNRGSDCTTNIESSTFSFVPGSTATWATPARHFGRLNACGGDFEGCCVICKYYDLLHMYQLPCSHLVCSRCLATKVNFCSQENTSSSLVVDKKGGNSLGNDSSSSMGSVLAAKCFQCNSSFCKADVNKYRHPPSQTRGTLRKDIDR